jgi:hypothetical protein
MDELFVFDAIADVVVVAFVLEMACGIIIHQTIC